MRDFIGFTKRNLLIYFKDVQAIIFSLLTSIIVFALYLLFLKGTFVDAVDSAMMGLENIVNAEDIDMLVSGILLVGIIGSALITVPYACLQTIVRDRELKVSDDICTTPIKRWKIILSYFTASVISSFIMTAIIFTIGIVILSFMGDLHLTVLSLLSCYGTILLGAISSTALFMLVVIFFKKNSASAAFFGILSAAAGFVIGAYIPLSQFSESVQSVCYLFPASHMTVLLRNGILNGVLDSINTTIGGLDNGLFIDAVKDSFSFNAKFFGNSMSIGNTVLYISAFAFVCIIAMVVLYSRTYKRK
jgi:multidrug/hemolysin transport system permease protein